MAKVIIFGASDTAQLAHYYLQNDSEHEVVAFSVDKKYMPSTGRFQGLPVIAFEQIVETYPPSEFHFFAPMTAAEMNRLRAENYQRIKDLGYSLISYVSSKATVLTQDIGDNCFILEDNTLQPFTRIENNVVLWSGNHIGHHSIVKSHAFISSHVVVSGHCSIGEYSYLGVNSTLRDGLTLAEGSFIAMSASVTKDTEAWQAYVGAPARRMNKKSTDVKIYHELD
jgi:sugar O-acyltransferase (sialic acid O-acetyltransferase NeuD family)